MVGFLFGGDTQETPESIKRKRDIVRALMGASAPKNVGEGINALGDGIVSAVLNERANKAEGLGKQSADSDFSALSSLFGGGAPPAMPGAAAELSGTSPTPAKPLDMSGNEVFGQFIDTVKQGGVQNPYALSAIAATGKAESGFDPKKATQTWSDPSESGQPGTSGGIMSWRGPRYQALAATGDLSPAGQAKFFLQENPQLIQSLNNAKSVEEAQSLMNNAWKFAGYDRPGGEASRRMQLASSFLPTFQGTEVASASPQAAMEAAAPASGYVDPMVSAPNSRPQAAPPMASGGTVQPDQQQMAALPPQQGADMLPALPPPVEVATPSVPPNAMPPQNQVAQALRQPPRSSNAELQAAQKVLSNQFSSEGQRAVAQALLRQELDRRNTEYEMQLKQQDPAYQLNLQKGQLELDNLRNPRISPAEQRRLDLEQQKFDFERNKPKDPTKVSQGEILVDPVTGKEIYKAAPKAEAKPSAVQEYEYAKNQGFPGTFQDWEASKKGGMSLQVDPATGAVTFQQGGNIKPMTEGQSKDTVYATRAEGALARLNENAAALSNLGESMASGVPVAGNYMLSPEYQQAQQAGKEFLQAILRKDTGAAITREETSEYGSVYLPQPGDSAEVAQQKAISRTRALEALKAGMPPQAIIAKEKALTATGDKKPAAPAGDPDFSKMTDEELQRYIDGK